MRLRQIARAAFRAIGRAVTGRRSGERPARPAGAGVYSGWIGPDGRVEETAGTAVHTALLARFGEPTRDGFFAKGAVRYVDATDHVSLELMGDHPVALSNAIDALARRWADTAEVDVEFLPTSELIHASSTEIRDALGRRLGAIPDENLDLRSRKTAGPERPMNSASTVRAFQEEIIAVAQQKLRRPLTAPEHAFMGGFLAPETMLDTVPQKSFVVPPFGNHCSAKSNMAV